MIKTITSDKFNMDFTLLDFTELNNLAPSENIKYLGNDIINNLIYACFISYKHSYCIKIETN